MSDELETGRRGSAEAGGYTLALAGVLVAVGLVFHPLPAGGFDESASVLADSPLWGAMHVTIAFGFVLCALGGLLILVSGHAVTRRWPQALFWGALTVGMIYFTGVALLNDWVMHPLAERALEEPILFQTMNDLVVGFGWLGNPLFLFGLTGIAAFQLLARPVRMTLWLALIGLIAAILSWGRGIGSATGLHFLEPLVLANIPAFLWMGLYGLHISSQVRARPPQITR